MNSRLSRNFRFGPAAGARGALQLPTGRRDLTLASPASYSGKPQTCFRGTGSTVGTILNIIVKINTNFP